MTYPYLYDAVNVAYQDVATGQQRQVCLARIPEEHLPIDPARAHFLTMELPATASDALAMAETLFALPAPPPPAPEVKAIVISQERLDVLLRQLETDGNLDLHVSMPDGHQASVRFFAVQIGTAQRAFVEWDRQNDAGEPYGGTKATTLLRDLVACLDALPIDIFLALVVHLA